MPLWFRTKLITLAFGCYYVYYNFKVTKQCKLFNLSIIQMYELSQAWQKIIGVFKQ